MAQEPFRILVVDDELGMRESCRKVLASEGYSVATAADGVEGLELFEKEGGFAAALIDLKMPRMGGIELIEKIRSMDEDILLLVITAFATIETAVEATKRGAYGYIPKPFTPDELMLQVKNGLERRRLRLESRQLREERERRLLEVAYERSKCGTIIDCMTDGVLVANLDRKVVLRNAAALRILSGLSERKVPFELAALDCGDLQNLLLETLLPSSSPGIVSREIRIGDATYMVNASPIIDQGGALLGGLALLRDITALKELSDAKSMFVSMVAHELKSPLAAIEGYLSLVLDDTAGHEPGRKRTMLERSLLRAKTLRGLVDELMSLRAMESGKFRISRTAMSLDGIIRELAGLYREKAREKNISLTTNMDGDATCPKVLADRDAMRSVFMNLIENAIKYTPAGGHVHIEVAGGDQFLNVSVTDDGIGMLASEQEHIFDEFFRARNAFTAGIPGTGLGLSLVRKLLDLHHAGIQVHSQPDKGSVFSVRIPLAASAQGLPQPPGSS